MKPVRKPAQAVDDAGLHWLGGEFPSRSQRWPRRKRLALAGEVEATREQLRRYTAGKLFVWPRREQIFLADMHADAEAFLRSLIGAGAIQKTGPEDHDLVLTEAGRRAVLIVGGDCFDKGPSNLRLLRTIQHVINAGAEVKLLAGNHDVRTYMGIALAGRRETHLAHLFVRMGKKTLPLFKEVYDEYLRPVEATLTFKSDEEVRAELFPPESWYSKFPEVVRGQINEIKLAKELIRIREKVADIGERCASLGMSLGQVEAALQKCRELFLSPGGEFSWFFERMTLAHRTGSLLFVHAGVDDAMAEVLRSEGVAGVNRRFRELMRSDLFDLYHGSVGNMFRTKYRDIDKHFSEDGLRQLHRAGIHTIVHGHKNVHHGQRIVLQEGMMHLECDCSVDAGTRSLEGLTGPGGAATIVRGDGTIAGISTDYDRIKLFETRSACGLTTFV